MHSKRKLATLGGVALAAALALTGCGSDEPPATPAPVEAEEANPGDGSGAPVQDDTTGVTLSAAQAVERALDEVDDGLVVQLDLDDDDGAQRWEVEVVDGSGIGTQFDLVGGDVVEQERFDPDDEDLEAHDVLAAEAIEIAEAETSAALIDLQLDRENGVLVWEVELRGDDGAEHEFNIDAMTGEVLGR